MYKSRKVGTLNDQRVTIYSYWYFVYHFTWLAENKRLCNLFLKTSSTDPISMAASKVLFHTNTYVLWLSRAAAFRNDVLILVSLIFLQAKLLINFLHSKGTDQGTSGPSHRKDHRMPSQGVKLHIHDRYVMQLSQSIMSPFMCLFLNVLWLKAENVAGCDGQWNPPSYTVKARWNHHRHKV